jgi:hypothetical protein
LYKNGGGVQQMQARKEGADLWLNPAMNPLFRTIALIGKYKSPEIAESLLNLAAFLRSRGMSR